MGNNNRMEKTRIWDRVNDLKVLFFFVIAAAVVSLFIMDLVIIPLSLFAVKHTDLFTFIVRDVTWIAIAATFIIMLIRRIYILRKDELSAKEILSHLVSKPVTVIALFLLIIILSLILIYLIYLLLHYNSYFIYKLVN
ncbi:MAG TPA: hypothetical protein PK544_06365 [Spirochaetota bacterium]|nr:hypothetical protein [Spirochaetota bacterium]HPJ38291.1 hypothetical protein [Spirochaetota bacterium]HPQ52664.1 hypothetical protein [Spirochaetota bacterium]